MNQAKAEMPEYSAKAMPTAVYATIPSGYNNAAVRTLLAAPRYSQTNTLYYFTKDNANVYAMFLDTGTIAACAGFLAGFIPKTGPAVALTFTVALLQETRLQQKSGIYQMKTRMLESTVHHQALVHFMVYLNGLVALSRRIKYILTVLQRQ